MVNVTTAPVLQLLPRGPRRDNNAQVNKLMNEVVQIHCSENELRDMWACGVEGGGRQSIEDMDLGN
jgi:hypothetical protein